MAKQQSTTRTRKRQKSSWEDRFAEKFTVQPARLTPEQRDEFELTFTGNDMGLWRRVGLASLARSSAELIESVTGDREVALEFARAQDEISDYATRLRSFADMMDSASLRIGLALCSREDMLVLMEEAKAVNSGQAVAHG
jgi:hypothetical protein